MVASRRAGEALKINIWDWENIMQKYLMGAALLCLASGAAFAAPTAATIITNADVKAVLKDRPDGDHTIRVIDMGQNYQMSVAVVHRGSTSAPSTRTPAQMAAAAAATAKLKDCGVQTMIDGKVGPLKNGMLGHHKTPETYIVIEGSGTLVTGGKIYKGKESAADAEVTTTLNGPTCSGGVTGDFILTNAKVGDIIVVPPDVPHGWSNIPSDVTYLSIRPDMEHVLPKAGFVYPALAKK
jgi:mannose-6-phosphate isomerase-like protein (cupin superfamily)